MSVTVMLITLLAALLHASWNFLVKRTDDKHLSMSAMAVGHLPFGLLALWYAPWPRLESWPYIVVGAMLHVGYQLFLMASYRIGDLSQVYPLARGVAPLMVTAVSILLLGVDFSWQEYWAIVAVAAGIMSLALVRPSDGLRRAHTVALSVATGGFIAAYSLVDGLGARVAGTALGFYSCLTIINAMVFAVVMRIIRPGILTQLVCRNRRLMLQIGGASFCAYAMVTWAFTLAPIALVTALRETSIVFALLLGVVVLRERFDWTKVFATALTILGIVLLRMNR